MNKGKVPENVLKRSILKKVSIERGEVLTAGAVGNDCACLQFSESDKVLLSSNPVTVDSKEAALYAVNSVVNNIVAAMGEPIGIEVTALLPLNTTEDEIKQITEKIVTAAAALRVDVIGGHTEITDAVIRPVLSVSAIGKRISEPEKVKNHFGCDIVISKWIGLEGTALLAKEKESELIKKFPSKMIYDAGNFDKYLSVMSEAAPAIKSGVCAMHDISKGGVFAGLWELAERLGVGLEIDLRKIPVKQETIEICNYFDINPYELSSMGSMLFVTKDGNRLVMELKKAGIEAAVVGKCTSGNDRILINGENRRFLDIPKEDELFKVL